MIDRPAAGRDRHVVLGGVLLASLLAFLVLVFSGALRDLMWGGGGRHVVVEFADAHQVRNGDPVRIDGVEVGKVSDVKPLDGRIGAAVQLHLDDDAGPLYADATARLRFKTVLGGAFSVTLDRGTAAKGELPAARIAIARTSGQVELDDLLQTVRGSAEAGLQKLPGELSETFEDPAPLRDTLATLDDVAPGVAAGADAARGTAEGYDLPRLVRSGARTMAALSDERALRTLVEGAAQTMQTTASRQLELRQTLASLPATLGETDVSLRALDGTLDRAEPVLARMSRHADAVAPTLRDLRPVLTRADTLLQRARPLLAQLRPASRSIARTATNGLPLLRALLPSIDRIDRVLLPALAEKDPVTEKSTAVMIGGWAAGLGSGAAAASDTNGHLIRFPATAGSSSTYLPCQTYVNNPDFKDQQVQCQSLNDAIGALLPKAPSAKNAKRAR